MSSRTLASEQSADDNGFQRKHVCVATERASFHACQSAATEHATAAALVKNCCQLNLSCYRALLQSMRPSCREGRNAPTEHQCFHLHLLYSCVAISPQSCYRALTGDCAINQRLRRLFAEEKKKLASPFPVVTLCAAPERSPVISKPLFRQP